MILSKKLQPRTERDILEEVAKELKIDIKDVNRTFDIWLDYIDYIANDTDQAAIHIPKVGQMYVSVHKMRRGMTTPKLAEFKRRKLEEIEKLRDRCTYIVHEKIIPIVLKYGLSRRNKKGEKNDKGFTEFFSARDIINNQADKFFEEDFYFSESKHLKKYFTTEEDD